MKEKCWYSTSSGRIELWLWREDAESGSHQGRCDEDIEYLSGLPHIREQFQSIPDKLLSDELREWGAWDDEQLSDRDANEARLLWLACGTCAINN